MQIDVISNYTGCFEFIIGRKIEEVMGSLMTIFEKEILKIYKKCVLKNSIGLL